MQRLKSGSVALVLLIPAFIVENWGGMGNRLVLKQGSVNDDGVNQDPRPQQSVGAFFSRDFERI